MAHQVCKKAYSECNKKWTLELVSLYLESVSSHLTTRILNYRKSRHTIPFLSSFSLVNSRWILWSIREDWSKTCGSGTKARRRSCSNPSPQHGGRVSSGPSKQIKSCLLRDCSSKCSVFMFTNNVNIYSLIHNYSYNYDCSATFSGKNCGRAPIFARPFPSSRLSISFAFGPVVSLLKSQLSFPPGGKNWVRRQLIFSY